MLHNLADDYTTPFGDNSLVNSLITGPVRPHLDVRLAAVQRYKEEGFEVVPLAATRNGKCTCGRADCKAAGKHPVIKNWTDAILDDAQLRYWLQVRADVNVGIRTGGVSGFFVIDEDGPQGQASLAAITSGRELPRTREARTGRGRHLYS